MKLKVSPGVVMPKFVDIEDSPKGTVLEIGEGSVIDNFVKFKPVGGTGNIEIGKSVHINSGTVFYSGNGIKIGDNVLIGPNCSIVPTNHEYTNRNKLIKDQKFQASKGGVYIGNDVWIGAGVTLLDGAHISDGCVVGAGSVIWTKLEPYGVYVGTPARKISERS